MAPGGARVNSKGPCLVVIPARGGSKGVSRKNLRLAGGTSLLARAIGAARRAKQVGRVLVSTDSDEIARHALDHGAEVVERPAHLSSDEASSESVLLHALDSITARMPELIMLLQCTAPMTQSEDLDGLIDTILRTNADSAFTAVPFHHFLWTGAGGIATPVNHSGEKRVRRQDLEPQFLESGAAYVMKTGIFRQTGERFCGKTVIHTLPSDRFLEIDSEVDLYRADLILTHHVPRSSSRLDGIKAVVFDFDGVMTDNAVYVDQDGSESVRCDRGDGMGIDHLRAIGIELLVLSKERNPVVTARARKLSLETMQAIDDKLTHLGQWLRSKSLTFEQALFVGNDINDLECMQACGYSACPSDAHHAVRSNASVVLSRRGGHGAVREISDLLIQSRDRAGRAGEPADEGFELA